MKYLLTLAACIMPAFVQAQMVEAGYPRSVVDAIQDMGYPATLETDSSGDPKVVSKIDGTNYSIWFYGCDEYGRGCDTMNFSAGFDLKNGVDISVINNWNRKKLLGRAYVDDEYDPFLDHVVKADGGIPVPTFRGIVNHWELAIREYKEAIGW